MRENWLNPADLVNRVPEVVPGYPDRILPKDEAVAEAYGWGDDYRAGLLTEDETLSRLFHLNQSRAAAQAK
ncbi:hypothetical protein [Thalassovita taeanensis]|uniref:hypothetical protein n=1 Tax=Thalassovita taeanensis TaxID=657014 RepID=UPI001C31744E|nr:hypothetical protein [Thalassovita taeanensis]